MNVNYTGGARKTFRRVSSRTQQDVTGTPAYHSNQRVRGRAKGKASRRHSASRTHSSNLNGQKAGAKRRKTSHHHGAIPEFDFAHARRDQEEQNQRTIEQANRIRHERNHDYGRSSLNPQSFEEYDPRYDTRPTFETHQGSTLQPAGETQSTHYIWQDDSEALDSYEQAQMAQSNRESSILRSSSIQASLPSANPFESLIPFQLPQERSFQSHSNGHDSYAHRDTFLRPPPRRPPTQMSSHSSNPASLSIISSPPHILPPYSTTPIGSPPPLPSLDGAPQSRQTFPVVGESSETRSNESIDTNPPSSTLQEFSADDQEEEERQTLGELSNERQQTQSDASNQLDSSLSLSNLQISSSGQSAIEGNDKELPLQIERLVSQASRSFTVLPPRTAEWIGPCCITRFQRDQLTSSFIFTNKLLEGDEGEEPVFVSDRMGLGCRGISQEEAIKLIQFEVSLRSYSLDVRYGDAKEREEEEVRFEELEWEEEDFEEQGQDFFSSRSRRPPDPPPVPLFDSSSSNEDLTVRAERGKLTLSNGPWNDLESEDESQTQTLAKDTFNLDSSNTASTSARTSPSLDSFSLDRLGDYEDISQRWKLLHYESAYESQGGEEGEGSASGNSRRSTVEEQRKL
ncbi:hypothetical protein JCM5350_005242 [Sporobolomyces pararoseus]